MRPQSVQGMLPSCVTTVNTNAFVPGSGLPLVDTIIASASLGNFPLVKPEPLWPFFLLR